MATAYVDNTATGANNGSSWGDAWTSFAAINWASLSAGDTLEISGGSVSKTYPAPGLVVRAGGSAGNPIVITRGSAAGHNGAPILDGGNAGSAWYGVNNGWNDTSGNTPQNHVTVRGLDVRNWVSAGLHVRSVTAGVIFEENDVLTGTSTEDPAGNRGIEIRLSTGGTIIRNNTVTTPVSTPAQADCMWVSDSDNFLIENNSFTVTNDDDTSHSDAIQLFQPYSGTIRNNVLTGPPAGAFGAPFWASDIRSGETIAFYGNVCISRHAGNNVGCIKGGLGVGTFLCHQNTIYGGQVGLRLDDIDLVEVKNNIIWPAAGGAAFRSDYGINDPPTSGIINNLIWAPSATIAITNVGTRTWAQWLADGYNANGLNVDPRMVDPGAGDFRPRATSPCRDRGVAISGLSHRGRVPDLGAIELQPPFAGGSTGMGV